MTSIVMTDWVGPQPLSPAFRCARNAHAQFRTPVLVALGKSIEDS